MSRQLRVGLAGFGNMARGHHLIIKHHPRLRGRLAITGTFEPDLALQETARRKKLVVFETFDDMISAAGIDAIIVSSPPQHHCDQVVAALEAGKHVYSEIPMALSEAEIRRIIAAEDASGKCYQLGENYVYYAEVLYAGWLVTSGTIGKAVYAEAEYLHDVTYRWRQGGSGGPETPRVDSWYSRFDPLMYAHSIGPAQVALGGLASPAPFVEVTSYANDLGAGGVDGEPVCAPAKAFHVALFKTPTGAIAKCANAYVFAREPVRMGIQVTGELGTFEASSYGKGGRLFLADDHVIVHKHRKGRARRIWPWSMRAVASHGIHFYISGNVRALADWLDAIAAGRKPSLHARVAANACMAGIRASEAARDGTVKSIPVFE